MKGEFTANVGEHLISSPYGGTVIVYESKDDVDRDEPVEVIDLKPKFYYSGECVGNGNIISGDLSDLDDMNKETNSIGLLMDDLSEAAT